MMNDVEESMSICPQCGHQVPTQNLAVHTSACGRAMRDRNRISNATSERVLQSDTVRNAMSTRDSPQEVIVIDDSEDETDVSTQQHLASASYTQQQTPPPVSTALSAADKQWTCPRCTLFNPIHATRCDACDYAYSPAPAIHSNDNPVRPPDPTQHGQILIEPNNVSDLYNNTYAYADPSNSIRFIGGGALIGSLLGAAGAYMRGRNVTNSIMEGAMTGVLGGVIARDVMATTSGATRSLQQGTMSNHESTDLNHSPTRRIVSITRRRYPDGTVETICEENGVRVVQQANHDDTTATSNSIGGGTNPFMMTQHPLLRSVSMTSEAQRSNSINHLRSPFTMIFPPAPHPHIRVFTTSSGMAGNQLDAIDGMDYERLLEIFGDGSDHRRAADEGTIRRLPTTRLKNVEDELPNDREYRLCSICLEEFSNGQTRKVLPCLHGFHDTCIDRWLGANACCPICKHSLHE